MTSKLQPAVPCIEWLPADDPLAARALRAADIKPAGLWARRARIGLRGAPLLMQEVFLPYAGLA